MSYLYLLVDGSGDGFKIGVSVDPAQRMFSLPETFDVTRSYQIKCGVKNSYRVEKMLHLLFKKYRLEKQRGNGYTEWFSMECFDAVNDFIRSQRDLLEWENFEPIQIKVDALDKDPILLAEVKAKRKIELSEIKKKKFIGYQNQNLNTIEALSNWVNMVRDQKILAGKFLANYYGKPLTHLAILNTGNDELLPDLYSYHILKNGHHRGGVNIISSYMSGSALKYIFITLTDLDRWLLSLEGIEPIVDIIESINAIQYPQLSEVIIDYQKIIQA